MTSHYQTGLDLPVGMVFPLLASLRFRWVTWCGATICKQKIRRATACKKVVWYNYVEQNDIQNNSLQKENEFVIQFPSKRDQMQKVIMYETYAYSLQNKWSNLQKYDRIWKLTNKITVNNYLQQNWSHRTICKKLSSTIGKRWTQT